MNLNYKITSQFINTVTEFYRLHGALYSLGDSLPWKSQLEKIAGDRAALSAVGIQSAFNFDNTIQDAVNIKIPAILQNDFDNYRQTKNKLGELFGTVNSLELSHFDKIHQSIIGEQYNPKENIYRDKRGFVPIVMFENGTYKKVTIPVKTKTENIRRELLFLNNWIKENYRILNPVLKAGIIYYQLVRIHPYMDGNGRTAKIFIHGILYQNGIDRSNILILEEYFLKQKSKYYKLLAETIETEDLTEWLEFFAEALLYGAIEGCNLLKKLSGGTIDFIKGEFKPVTENQKAVIDVMQEYSHVSGAEVARKLNFSRQYVNNLMHELIRLNIVEKTGNRKSTTYNLITSQ